MRRGAPHRGTPLIVQTQAFPLGLYRPKNRKRLVANQSRREGVYNRAGDVSVTFCGEEERRNA